MQKTGGGWGREHTVHVLTNLALDDVDAVLGDVGGCQELRELHDQAEEMLGTEYGARGLVHLQR